MNPKERREQFDKFKMVMEGMAMMIPEGVGINPTDIENWGCKYASVKVRAFVIVFKTSDDPCVSQAEHNELKVHTPLQANGTAIVMQIANCDAFVKRYVELEWLAYGYPGWAALLDDNDGDEEEVATRSIVVQKEIIGGKSKDKAKAAAVVIEDEDGEESGELRTDHPTVFKKAAVGRKARKMGKEAAVAEPTCPKPQAIRGASLVPEEDKDNDEDFEEEEKGFVVRSSPYDV